MRASELFENIWYGNHPLSVALLPLSWIFRVCINIRKFIYAVGLLPRHEVNVPVIVVGNITVGGTGKTPVIVWLSHHLTQMGYRPGIISRGYGGRSSKWPQQVRPDSDPFTVGDEPVLLARRTNRPVAVSPNRYQASTQLLAHTECDVLLCDDGLQHLSLDRDLEILVVDGDRRFGNGRCLPAGPLREPISKLNTVDMVISRDIAGKNEFLMQYEYDDLISVNNEKSRLEIQSLRGKTIHVVTGIANPRRFHAYLKSQEIQIICHIYPDHHHYKRKDIHFSDDLPVVMTEKDAVKCRDIASENSWYIPINARFNDVFLHRINKLLREMFNG